MVSRNPIVNWWYTQHTIPKHSHLFKIQSWRNRGIWSMFDVSLGELLDMGKYQISWLLGCTVSRSITTWADELPIGFCWYGIVWYPEGITVCRIYTYIYMCVYIKAAGVYWANVKAPQTWMVLGVFGFQHVETFLKRDSVNRTQIHQTWATTHNSYPDGNSSKALTSSFILQASDRFCFSYFIYFDTRTPYPPLPVGCFLLARSPTIPACLRRIVDSNMVLGNFSQRLGESLRGFFRRRSLEVGHDNWASNLTENGW